jgi:2-alkyl-3-oxoalkanoate reductase
MSADSDMSKLSSESLDGPAAKRLRRVLVLGSSGFIGARVVTRLLHTDWAKPIAGLRRLKSPGSGSLEQRVLDATDEASIARSIADVDAVVNCVAGEPRTIAEGARILSKMAAQMNPAPTIVHLSTMSVYGPATGVVAESASLLSGLGPYADAKISAEQALAAYPNLVILRPGCVYGPGSPRWSVLLGELLLDRRLGDLGAGGDGYANLVHVDDVVTAICRALREPQLSVNAFNLSSPQPLTWNEFLIRYAVALSAVPVRRISHRRQVLETKMLAPALKLIEKAAGVLNQEWIRLPPAVPPSLLSLMRQKIRLDVTAAEQALELRWTPIDQGIDQTAQWFLQRNSRKDLALSS